MMNGTFRTLALVAIVSVGAFTGATVAASDASLSASPATPGEVSTHTATLTVGSSATGSLNGLQLDYSEAGADISNVGVENIRTVGIDRDDDADGASIDEDVSTDLESAQGSNNGETLTLQFGGSASLNEGDELVVVVEEVQNPDAGEYAVGLDINPQSSGGATEATLSIGSSSGDSTATDESRSADGDATVEDAGESEASSGSGVGAPGFGAGLTVLALLGAAFVAVRQHA